MKKIDFWRSCCTDKPRGWWNAILARDSLFFIVLRLSAVFCVTSQLSYLDSFLNFMWLRLGQWCWSPTPKRSLSTCWNSFPICIRNPKTFIETLTSIASRRCIRTHSALFKNSLLDARWPFLSRHRQQQLQSIHYLCGRRNDEQRCLSPSWCSQCLGVAFSMHNEIDSGESRDSSEAGNKRSTVFHLVSIIAFKLAGLTWSIFKASENFHEIWRISEILDC